MYLLTYLVINHGGRTSRMRWTRMGSAGSTWSGEGAGQGQAG